VQIFMKGASQRSACPALEVEAFIYRDNRQVKVVRLSAVHTSRLCPSGDTPYIRFC